MSDQTDQGAERKTDHHAGLAAGDVDTTVVPASTAPHVGASAPSAELVRWMRRKASIIRSGIKAQRELRPRFTLQYDDEDFTSFAQALEDGAKALECADQEVAALAAVRAASPAWLPQEKNEDLGAGLIHPVASPLAETEPRPNRKPQTMLIEAAAVITTLRREADHLDSYTGVPCQSENSWHARDYRRWANLIDDLVAQIGSGTPAPSAERAESTRRSGTP